jgi:hypothetical protein
VTDSDDPARNMRVTAETRVLDKTPVARSAAIGQRVLLTAETAMQMLNPFAASTATRAVSCGLTICNAGSLNILGSAVINGVREGLETLGPIRTIRVLSSPGKAKEA